MMFFRIVELFEMEAAIYHFALTAVAYAEISNLRFRMLKLAAPES